MNDEVFNPATCKVDWTWYQDHLDAPLDEMYELTSLLLSVWPENGIVVADYPDCPGWVG